MGIYLLYLLCLWIFDAQNSYTNLYVFSVKMLDLSEIVVSAPMNLNIMVSNGEIRPSKLA